MDANAIIESPPSIFRYLDRQDFGAKPFVVRGDDVLTYGTLREIVARTAGFFDEHRIGPRERIGICSEHDIETIALYLAAMRLGVTPVLIDPHASPDEALTIVRAADLSALFMDQRRSDRSSLAAALLPGSPVFGMAPASGLDDGSWLRRAADHTRNESYPSLLASYGARHPRDGIDGETSAFILFTSGTTSRPKGVEVTHAAVAAHMATMHAQYGYGVDSRILNGLPLHHSDGINHGAVNVLAAGATLFRTGTFSVQRLPEILRLIGRERITHLITVPTVLALIAQLGDRFSNAFRTGDFRFVSSTAGPLDEQLWRAFEERFGTMIVNSYGLTETICEGFYCGPTDETRRIGTIGKPIDIDVRLIGADGRDVAPGQMGELLLRGSCVMKGYYNAPEETAAILRDGWLYTGDLAIRDAEGFYAITGRKKNVIITGGLNVYPEDVTRTILQMPEVADAATIGVSDDTWGERVVSCVVSRGAAIVAAEDVIGYCRMHLSREKVPSEVLVLQELPRGPSGKIALPQLRQLVAERLAGRISTTAVDKSDSRDVKARVFDIAARSFKTPVDGLSLESEPESTAGWSSLAHVDFLMAIENEFGITIGPGDMLDIETLGDAVELVARKRA